MHATPLIVCALSAALVLTSEANAQRLGGRVVLQGWHEAVSGAEVLLLDADLTTIARRTSDEQGGFVFDTVGPGIYHLQAQRGGLQSALLGPFRAEAADVTDELLLELPSTLLNHALACAEDNDLRRGGVLVGVAHEAGSSLPLPGALVALQWQSGSTRRSLTAHADERGQYRFCDAPADVPLRMYVSALGQVSAPTDVEIEPGAIVRRDLALDKSTVRGDVIALDAIDVEGRSLRGRRGAVAASHAVSGPELRRAIERGATLQDVVRVSFPLQVREWRDREGRIHLCIDGRRREIMAPADVYSLDELPVQCGGETVAIVVDEVLLQDPVGFYRAARLDTYETIEYMPPLEAGIRFGLGAGRAGAIVLWSIGRTPRGR